MKYLPEIQSTQSDPAGLEALYQAALQANEEAEFRADLLSLHEQASDNLLLAAWYHRFQHHPLPLSAAAPARRIRWDLAALLGLATGLVLWAISDPQLMYLDQIPYYGLFWAPIATLFALLFLAIVSRQNYRRSLLLGLGLVLAGGYVLLMAWGQKSYLAEHYLLLMAAHLPLLCWIALGLALLGWRSRPEGRFAFLIKSLEVVIAAGLYLIFGVAFGGITIGMFEALNITLPDIIIRLISFGGFGLLPLLAVATMYDPHNPPAEQDFSQGLSRFIATMMRLLLPLTLLVLVIYIFIIPFNFMAPFEDRDVLIVYNIMLFAIIGLLFGATPLHTTDGRTEFALSPRVQELLRKGILAVAALAGLVGLYALAAVVYRTALGGLTINRTAIIGWNVVNISILGALVVTQLRGGMQGWAERLQIIFSRATLAYVLWALFVLIATPILFR